MPTQQSPEGPAGSSPAGDEASDWQGTRARVDARLLEATLLNLRKQIAAVPLVFDLPGADEIAGERAKLLAQIDDYLLPRVRESAAPLLVALVGSTGAGKSTLANSLVGAEVSLTGVRRPTTNSPVLVCHPDDAHWFGEDMFLPTLPRVRQDDLVRPGRDGLLVLAMSEVMTKGIALLDTPDIDSVVHAHHDFAHQFLDTSDLWLFMTSASRYADAPGWDLLQHARERGAALGVILSRVPPGHEEELAAHFAAMLDANGIEAEQRFLIPEIPKDGIVDGFLPEEIAAPIKDWLDDTAQHADRRVAVLTKTMAGMIDTFKTRVPQLAAHVDAQVLLRTQLRGDAENAYASALAAFDEGTRGSRLLAGEVLTRWQEYADSGELAAALRGRQGQGFALRRGGKRTRADEAAGRYAALEEALRAALSALVVSVADHAAEQVTRAWRDNPAGAALLSAAEESRSRARRAKREFDLTFGPAAPLLPPGAAQEPDSPEETGYGSFARSAPDLPLRISRAVSAWQDQLMRLQRPDAARRQEGGAGPLSVVTLVALLCTPAPAHGRPDPVVPAPREAARTSADDVGAEPRQALAALVGGAESEPLLSRARHDLRQRIELLFDEEMLRFKAVLDEAGEVDAAAAVRLYQAEHALEAAR